MLTGSKPWVSGSVKTRFFRWLGLLLSIELNEMHFYQNKIFWEICTQYEYKKKNVKQTLKNLENLIFSCTFPPQSTVVCLNLGIPLKRPLRSSFRNQTLLIPIQDPKKRECNMIVTQNSVREIMSLTKWTFFALKMTLEK